MNSEFNSMNAIQTELIILFLFTAQTVWIFWSSYANIPFAQPRPHPLCSPPLPALLVLTVASINLLFIRRIFRKTKNCIEQFARRWVNNLFIVPLTPLPPFSLRPATDNKRQP